MSQAAERPDGRLSISRTHHTLSSPWYTPSFHCKDTCFVRKAIRSGRTGPRLGHSCHRPYAWAFAENVGGAQEVLLDGRHEWGH